MCARWRQYAAALPGVAMARDYKYMCSDPGQELIKQDIREHKLNRIVVAACSPQLHEKTFRNAAAEGGINPYFFQMVNVREHDSWVHVDKAAATEKARDLIRAAIRRVKLHKPLEKRSVPIHPAVLVVGGGIAGIHAALSLANAGKHVYLVEREPTIGGHMAMFDKTFPTLDCAACILTPKMTAVRSHRNITLWTLVGGGRRRRLRRQLQGDGEAQAALRDRGRLHRLPGVHRGLRLQGRQRPRRVQPRPGQAQAGLHPLPAGGAANWCWSIPETCIEFKSGKCKKTCVEACAERKAIDFKQPERTETIDVGAIILATGFKAFDAKRIPYYGYGHYPNVYTSLEVERLVNASGPTGGEVVLRDGRKPKTVGIVHCVGSRDEHTNRYCSRVCCMYSLKLAHLLKEKTAADVYNFYIDMRTPGKGFEEFYNRVAEEGVYFIRGKVADVYPEPDGGGRLMLQAEDTLLGRVRKIPVDMLVLAVGLEAQPDAQDVRRLFNITCAGDGFFLERHPKLAPVNTFTDGIFLAGCCQGPKDIPDTVAQAGAAACEALALIDAGLDRNGAEHGLRARRRVLGLQDLHAAVSLQRDLL